VSPAAQPLTGFAGTALYVDAMLLVAFLDRASRWHTAARQMFQRAGDPTELHLVTATLTLDEVVFVLLQELVARPPHAVTRGRA
jgi:predicted nucleic acid-binding protein